MNEERPHEWGRSRQECLRHPAGLRTHHPVHWSAIMARRWIGIRASGGLTVAGSLATLALGGLMLVSMTLAPPPTGPAAPPFPMATMGIVMASIFALFSGWGIWTAIGVFRRRGWARISILIFAVLLTFMGVGGGLAILVVQLPAQPNVTQGMMNAVRWGMAGFYGLLAGIGVWWLVLFNLRSTKEYSSRRRPVRRLPGL